MFKIGQPGQIVTLLKDGIKNGVKPIFFLGAGASKQSGVKLVVEIVEEAAKWAYCRDHGISIDDPRLTMSDWKSWLVKFPWYTEDYSTLYPIIIENLLIPRQARKDFFLKIINPDVPASQGYEKLAELMALGMIDTVLTGNFDNCLANAKVQIRKPAVIQTIKTPSDLTQFAYTPRYPQLVYLHGSVEHYTDQNLNNEIQNLNSDLVAHIKPVLKDRPLVVIGYRGAEPSIMNDLFLANLSYTNSFHQGIYWCLLKRDIENITQNPNSAPPLFTELAKKTNGNFQVIPIDGFDELMSREIMGKLQATEIDLKNNNILRGNPNNSPAPTFDTQIIARDTIGSLEQALIRERLKSYSERLGIKVYDDQEWLYQQMIRLRIGEFALDDKIELTSSGILLFSSKTQDFIPGSFSIIKFIGDKEWLDRITSTSFGQDYSENTTEGFIEKMITGNIWNQLDEITDTLAIINKPFRLKGITSENVYPYPTLALKEVIVNSLVHRNYSTNLPVVIEVFKDKIKFISPGGLVEEVKRQLSNESIEDEIRKGKRGIKGYRNPVLADLFYGSGAMDKEGSGLSDVLKQVTSNAAVVNFGPSNKNEAFEVVIYRRMEEIDNITKTAVPLTVNDVTKYTCNLFEVLNTPRYVYHAEPRFSSAPELFAKLNKSWCPPFLLIRKRIWCFYDLGESQNPLRNFVDLGTIEKMSDVEFVDITGNYNEYVRMLNDCLAQHFYSVGLRVDMVKKRAYFTKTIEGTAKEISYQARVKKATRTVAKPRINPQSGNIYYWEHKSIWYSFERIENTWYLILNPSYVFTTDGYKTFLRSEKVNILSTKKASRDYNLAVHNDITFWAYYISLGSDSAFLLRPSDKDINSGLKLGPIPPEIIISAKPPTITISDVSITEEFVEPLELEDMEEVELELENLAKEEQRLNEEKDGN
ncbi:MAG: hypothetical protein J0I84_06160 [Terrimonas sp.]|nr:hypothetical protein [Terrimonas sp.]OJY97984.1 MAG: hypothetical protein BGP13_09985 [Sphingobacteriales bacterium 40-81]